MRSRGMRPSDSQAGGGRTFYAVSWAYKLKCVPRGPPQNNRCMGQQTRAAAHIILVLTFESAMERWRRAYRRRTIASRCQGWKYEIYDKNKTLVQIVNFDSPSKVRENQAWTSELKLRHLKPN